MQMICPILAIHMLYKLAEYILSLWQADFLLTSLFPGGGMAFPPHFEQQSHSPYIILHEVNIFCLRHTLFRILGSASWSTKSSFSAFSAPEFVLVFFKTGGKTFKEKNLNECMKGVVFQYKIFLYILFFSISSWKTLFYCSQGKSIVKMFNMFLFSLLQIHPSLLQTKCWTIKVLFNTQYSFWGSTVGMIIHLAKATWQWWTQAVCEPGANKYEEHLIHLMGHYQQRTVIHVW